MLLWGLGWRLLGRCYRGEEGWEGLGDSRYYERALHLGRGIFSRWHEVLLVIPGFWNLHISEDGVLEMGLFEVYGVFWGSSMQSTDRVDTVNRETASTREAMNQVEGRWPETLDDGVNISCPVTWPVRETNGAATSKNRPHGLFGTSDGFNVPSAQHYQTQEGSLAPLHPNWESCMSIDAVRASTRSPFLKSEQSSGLDSG